MKFQLTNPAGYQTVIETAKSHAQLELDFPSCDIQPIPVTETPSEEKPKAKAKVTK